MKNFLLWFRRYKLPIIKWFKVQCVEELYNFVEMQINRFYINHVKTPRAGNYLSKKSLRGLIEV